MNEIATFKFQEHQVRTVTDERGEPWFVAKDVCDVLEIKDPSMAVRDLEPDEKGTSTVGTPGGNQNMLTVSESGLYALIFKSRKPEAKAFRKWVTSEVLPAIRKTGGYVNPAAADRWYTAKEVAALWGACLRSAQRHLAIMVAEGRCEMDDASFRRHRKQPILYRFPDGLPASPHESPTRPVLPSSVDLPKLAKEFKALKAMAVAAGKRGALAVRLADDATRRLRFVSPLELLGIEAPPETDAANIAEALISAADPDQKPDREGREP